MINVKERVCANRPVYNKWPSSGEVTGSFACKLLLGWFMHSKLGPCVLCELTTHNNAYKDTHKINVSTYCVVLYVLAMWCSHDRFLLQTLFNEAWCALLSARTYSFCLMIFILEFYGMQIEQVVALRQSALTWL
jgi:hypothetical protein